MSNSTAVRSYGKYEFCKAVECGLLETSKTHADQVVCCAKSNHLCIYSAKEFHKWLSKEGFMILKKM